MDYAIPRSLLQIHPRPVVPQPILALLEVRHHLVHLVPEGFGVVRVNQVGKLVDYNVVDDGQRGHHALPVEVQVAARRAGRPPMLEVDDLDRPRLHVHFAWKKATRGGILAAPFSR